ncbi:CU044_5270 family protein [Amycolatopsis sp. cg5]|uniref:CU044_5270 family protein n=1 Tax=Amycolatopsis sp. cg5 TaxID=3238802 RepID=UPI0035247888
MNDLEEIRRLLPPAAAPDPLVVAQARARVFTAKPASSPIRRRAMLAAALGAVVVAGIVVVADNKPTGPLSGRDVLLVAATQAAKQPATSGRFYLSRKLNVVESDVGTAPDFYQFSTRFLSENWVAADPAAPDFGGTVNLGSKPTKPSDVEAWKRQGSPARITVRDGITVLTVEGGEPRFGEVNREEVLGYGVGPNGERLYLTRQEMNSLPADPDQLKSFLLGKPLDPQVGGEAWLIRFATYLLSEFPIRPEARAGLFRMLAGLEDVRSEGPATDPEGRPGMALTIAPKAGRNEGAVRLIVDTATGKLLSYEFKVTAQPVVSPINSSVEVVLSAEWTNDDPKPPSTEAP